jgi:dihydroorotase
MAELAEAGCVGFFQGRARLPDMATLLQAMRYAATFGFTVWLRPEEGFLAQGVAHDGEVATRLGLAPIPVIAETIALRAILELMHATGARVHIARLSSAAGVAIVADAKARGVPITCDVAVNHLHLSDRDIGDFDAMCNLAPPLRSRADRDGLRAAVAAGTIDAVCSDHTPVDEDAKTLPFGEAEPGATGLELLLALALRWGEDSKAGIVRALSVITHAPAKVLGSSLGTLQASIGQLAAGGVADLCVFDPQAEWTVTPDALRSQGKNTPFAGYELTGKVRYTLVGGEIVYEA